MTKQELTELEGTRDVKEQALQSWSNEGAGFYYNVNYFLVLVNLDTILRLVYLENLPKIYFNCINYKFCNYRVQRDVM